MVSETQALVKQALAVPVRDRRRGEVSDAEIELALAWLQGVVTTAQVMAVLFPATKTGDAPAKGRLAVVLREAYRRRYLTIREVEEKR